ncbi:MarR family transcriptional regulator [Nonomuraea phyllanthi]|uniref:MarR family transcriptional regulator n=2 Tax=Nonomuraea phyllanthi TaxID=2219224 RepID=A0A5C4WIW4_9ACTN|nr:MarR family transcriptional regulator [Nonomuraea phyllanthi]
MSTMSRPLPPFMQLQHLIRVQLREALANLDLTPEQSTVLNLVAATPGISSAELARLLHVTPQTMHKIVTELGRRSLLEMHPRPGHGRILGAELTARGQTLKGQADVFAQAVEDRMVADLDAHQRRQLASLLQQCVTTIGGPSSG